LKIKLLFIPILLSLIGCHKRLATNDSASESANQPITTKVVQNEVDKEDEDLMKGPKKGSPSNSVIIGKIVEITPPDLSQEFPCNEVSCLAKVELMAMSKFGSSFHGQYNEGQVLTVRFVFTLEQTSERFPELNEPLPGLDVNNFFEAELFESEEKGYSVKLYKLMN